LVLTDAPDALLTLTITAPAHVAWARRAGGGRACLGARSAIITCNPCARMTRH
jgi:hypothetical protein